MNSTRERKPPAEVHVPRSSFRCAECVTRNEGLPVMFCRSHQISRHRAVSAVRELGRYITPKPDGKRSAQHKKVSEGGGCVRAPLRWGSERRADVIRACSYSPQQAVAADAVATTATGVATSLHMPTVAQMERPGLHGIPKSGVAAPLGSTLTASASPHPGYIRELKGTRASRTVNPGTRRVRTAC